MKKIEAFIRPEKLPLVRKALDDVGVRGITIVEVKGHGVQKGITQQWRGTTFTLDLLPKVKLEVFVPEARLEPAVSAIREAARTGEIGDGKIFVLEVTEAIRVRTGERGEGVL
jgi:nitrogen regulatory protein P-II 1